MPKFMIRYGLGGGFGGPGEWEEIEAKDLGHANQQAYELACQKYELYDGKHGLLSFEDIREKNPDWSDEDIEQEWLDNRESWLDYEVEEI
jgi:hypothetical protein